MPTRNPLAIGSCNGFQAQLHLWLRQPDLRILLCPFQNCMLKPVPREYSGLLGINSSSLKPLAGPCVAGSPSNPCPRPAPGVFWSGAQRGQKAQQGWVGAVPGAEFLPTSLGIASLVAGLGMGKGVAEGHTLDLII